MPQKQAHPRSLFEWKHPRPLFRVIWQVFPPSSSTETRTPDPTVNGRLLCQLSYRGICKTANLSGGSNNPCMCRACRDYPLRPALPKKEVSRDGGPGSPPGGEVEGIAPSGFGPRDGLEQNHLHPKNLLRCIQAHK